MLQKLKQFIKLPDLRPKGYTLLPHLDSYLDYVKTFDQCDEIKAKRDHTYRVISNAGKIAAETGLDKENVYLAKVIALLHDVGRFEQWKQFKTFSDSKADHAMLASKVLFDDNLISKFDINKKYWPTIRFAVENHNKLDMGTTDLPKKNSFNPILHLNIVRDADMLDIIENIQYGNIPPRLNKSARRGISPVVMKQVKKRSQINTRDSETKADRVVVLLSFAHGLKTDAARRMFINNDYITSTVEAFRSELGFLDTMRVKKIADKIDKNIHEDLNIEYCQ